MDRKNTPGDIETAVLTNCARRCALCFGLNGDLTEKLGQIAHLDQTPSNYAQDNLAFLCMEHHSVYDSRTSQHKNYLLHEVKHFRDQLHDAIVKGEHHASARYTPSPEAFLDNIRFKDQRSGLPETPFVKELWQGKHWRILIHPTQFLEAQFQTLKDCEHFMRTRHIVPRGQEPYPLIHSHFQLVSDNELQAVTYELDPGAEIIDTIRECWALFRTGQFVHTRALPQHRNFSGIHFLEILRVVSQVFEFARRMAVYNALSPEGLISISLRNIAGVNLFVPDNDSSMFCKTNHLDFSQRVSATVSMNEAPDLATQMALQFYTSFGWNNPDIASLTAQQRRFI